ncbi:MAG: hypothetical protein RL065_25 [Bacteroidota bacterium]|jgi:hypothetical protein
MASKKNILEIEPDYDFGLIAITATVAEYILCIYLDKQFNLLLVKQDSIFVKKNKQEIEFLLFALNCDVRQSEFCLINNKSEGNYFLSEMRQTDYLLRFRGEWANDNHQKIIDFLKTIDGVQVVVKVDVETIKQKEMLTFELPDLEYKLLMAYRTKRTSPTN